MCSAAAKRQVIFRRLKLVEDVFALAIENDQFPFTLFSYRSGGLAHEPPGETLGPAESIKPSGKERIRALAHGRPPCAPEASANEVSEFVPVHPWHDNVRQ